MKLKEKFSLIFGAGSIALEMLLRGFIVLVVLQSTLTAGAQYSDIGILRSINHNRLVGMDGTMLFVSKTVTPLGIACPLTMILIGKAYGDKATYQNGIKSGLAITATVFTYTLLKYTINRERPYNAYGDIDKLANESTPSFPSGHTSSAFCTATSLSLVYPKWYVIVPAYSWAALVGYSRMHLGMHYPSDVLAGAILGAGTSLLTYKIYQWMGKRKDHHGV